MVKPTPLMLAFAALAIAVAALPLLLSNTIESEPSSSERRSSRYALFAALWLALTFVAAASGRLSFSSVPPTMAVPVVASLLLAVRFAFSPLGTRLARLTPLGWLVAAQGFRLPLELLMHRAMRVGLMPPQMSYSGRNFDILTGATALLLGAALLRWRVPRWLVLGWNLMGLVLLLNVVIIALLSAPTPLRTFMNEPANTWITHAPWIWLPTVFVPAALAGHLVVFRRLRAAWTPAGEQTAAAPSAVVAA